jgi:D-aminopeptidase
VYKVLFVALIVLQVPAVPGAQEPKRPRARDLGIVVGVLPPGPLDAITDVAGVEVGQTTIIRGESVRTGVTVILPHAGNMFQN